MNSHRLRPHTCKICYKKFATEETYLRHHQNTHLPKKEKPEKSSIQTIDYVCQNCDRVFKTEALLSKHIDSMVLGLCNRVPDTKNRACHICNLDMGSNKMKLKHLESHQDIVKNCSLCTYESRSIVNFENHLMCHIYGFDFFCSDCGKNFKSRNLLKEHVRTVHEMFVKLYLCDLCGE